MTSKDAVFPNKRALVLGANAGQSDLIRYLKRHDWFVVACSARSGEVGEQLCDVFERADVRDLDALETLAEKYAVSLVYSVSSDLAIKSVVGLAERLGLSRFFDSAFVEMLDDKTALRGFLDRHDLGPVPFLEVRSAEEAASWSRFPSVVKPADAQGQRGVEKVDSQDRLAEALRAATAASSQNKAIVETFLKGVELSCNVLLAEGRAVIKVLSERLVHDIEQIGIPRGHLIPPASVPEQAQKDALDLVDRVVQAFGQREGVLYFQMIVTDEGPRIVEVAPRLDGCHMWRAIRSATDVDLLDMAVRQLVGEDLPTFQDPLPLRRGVELMFQQTAPGRTFDPAEFPEPADALYHEYRYQPGDTILPVNGMLEVVGYYVRATS